MSNHIEARDFDANRSLRSRPGERRSLLDDDVSLMSEVADGIIERDRRRMQREVVRVISFVCAILNCLCAGSITTFSIYGPYFQKDLHYNQIRINSVSIAAEVAMYLPVPLLGYLCDRYSPAPLALLGSALFGSGYLLAAFTYKSGPPKDTGYGDGWPFEIMVLSFIAVGIGTASLYLAGVATCAKNFNKSKHAGLVLAIPIASFGLSGMWQSQVGEHLLQRRGSNDLDVFRYFLFLGILLMSVGLIGSLGLRVVGEEELIDERVEELERSGLLQESEFFRPTLSRQNTGNSRRNYGAIARDRQDDQVTDDEESDAELDLSESMLLAKQMEADLRELERQKKNWLLNRETKEFLSDPTMWYLAAGFFLLTGPGEAFINNLGTIIDTLTPRSWASRDPPAGTASTHVSTIAITSTIARLLTGTLCDILAPSSRSSDNPKVSRAGHSDSSHSNPTTPLSGAPPGKITGLSRMYLLFISCILLLFSFIALALIVPSSPSVFPLSSALLGFGYGASFSLVPILISIVWDVENFATNWGIVALVPAGGAALWSAVYAVGYGDNIRVGDDRCYGAGCFRGWAWGCAGSVVVAIALLAGAWRGWKKRGVVL